MLKTVVLPNIFVENVMQYYSFWGKIKKKKKNTFIQQGCIKLI